LFQIRISSRPRAVIKIGRKRIFLHSKGVHPNTTNLAGLLLSNDGESLQTSTICPNLREIFSKM
jgi:hypothetical protein